jgi:hypothetical protein
VLVDHLFYSYTLHISRRGRGGCVSSSGQGWKAMTDNDQRQRSNDDGVSARTEEDAPGGMALREEGGAARRGVSFDPTPHIQQLRGRGGNTDYLGVRWSLVWLRKEHPDAQIVTEHVQIDPTIAIFKATVSLPTGGRATGYGSETAADFGDYIEKAETKAIGRALRALGFGAPNSEADDEPDVGPPPASARPAAATDPVRPRPTPIERPAPAVTEAARPRVVESTPPARPRPAAAEPVPTARPARAAAAPSPATQDARPADDADLADYSWTAFWPWARGIGLPDKKAIEDLIGRSTDSLSPAELRGLILTAKGEG